MRLENLDQAAIEVEIVRSVGNELKLQFFVDGFLKVRVSVLFGLFLNEIDYGEWLQESNLFVIERRRVGRRGRPVFSRSLWTVFLHSELTVVVEVIFK